MALDENNPKHVAKGWTLQWISRDSEEAKDFVAQLDKTKQQKNEQRKELLAKQRLERRKQKMYKKYKDKSEKLQKRIEIWEEHLKKISSTATLKCQSIKNKIESLQKQKNKLLETIKAKGLDK